MGARLSKRKMAADALLKDLIGRFAHAQTFRKVGEIPREDVEALADWLDWWLDEELAPTAPTAGEPA